MLRGHAVAQLRGRECQLTPAVMPAGLTAGLAVFALLISVCALPLQGLLSVSPRTVMGVLFYAPYSFVHSSTTTDAYTWPDPLPCACSSVHLLSLGLTGWDMNNALEDSLLVPYNDCTAPCDR